MTMRGIQSMAYKARFLSVSNRCFHNSAIRTEKMTTRGTRLAGRQRFYKQVGVKQVTAPWEKQEEKSVVDSPISAGVDGSDSASGVQHLSQDLGASRLEYLLSPRRPGSTTVADGPNEWYGITLDGRTMKTPMGQIMAVPSQSLAYAIAAEWDAQTKYLQPANMPLMTLACTALDQVVHNPQAYREQSLNYLTTDTTCFWADPTEERILHRRQQDAWKDLHGFVEERFHHAPVMATGASEGILMARKRGDGKPNTGLPHHPTLVDKATEWTHTLDAWHLVAFSSMCAQAKSFLVAWAVLEPDSPFKEMTKAVEAARVEEEFQISSWGLVEGGHDYDRLNCSIQLRSGEVFTKTIKMDNKL